MVTHSEVSCFTYSRMPGVLFQALVYRDGNLVSGSLEALVQHMVPTEEYYPDRAYLFAFLLSARLFIKPHELLGEVCALCEHQQNLNGEGGKVSSRFLYYSSSSFLLLLDMSTAPPRARLVPCVIVSSHLTSTSPLFFPRSSYLSYSFQR